MSAASMHKPAEQGWRGRIERWIIARTPRVKGPALIDRRRIYILPTRYGYGYAVLLLAMLLGAMNYSNSMAFALTFLLAGMGLLAMHHTHGNLVNIAVSCHRVEPVFCDEALHWPLTLENRSKTARYALTASWGGDLPRHHVDLNPGESGTVELTLSTERRGPLPLPRFSVSTQFPLGLFRAWTWIALDVDALVYPRPSGLRIAIPAGDGQSGQSGSERRGSEEFSGLRNYQRGDALRSIHWKSLAKQRSPMVKLFVDASSSRAWLDWNNLPTDWNIEQRLSQITQWMLDCEAAGTQYGVAIPGFRRTPGLGDGHLHECLRALALFPR